MSADSDLFALAQLVDLYEYKVADLRSGHEPRGGQRSMRELRRILLTAQLPANLLRRAVHADRLYRAWQQQQRGAQSGAAAPVTYRAPTAHNPHEAQAWYELRQLLWHGDLLVALHDLTQDLRSEPLRPTLRVLYAVTENAERMSRRIKAPFDVPEANDSLVSLGNPEVVRQLTRTLGDMLLAPGDRQLVWQALQQVQLDPFPHLVAQRHASERPQLREAALRLQGWLEPWLQRAPQGWSGMVPPQSILFGQEPSSALQTPLESNELTLYLGATQQQTLWQGLKLSWRSLGPNWQLLVQAPAVAGDEKESGHGQVALLRPDLPPTERHLKMEPGGHPLRVFFTQQYVLLQLVNASADLLALARLAAQGRALRRLLLPDGQYGHLRLARAAVQRLRGGPPRSDEGDAERYQALAPEERLALARRTLDSLQSLLERQSTEAVVHALHASAASLGLPQEWATRLCGSLQQAAFEAPALPPPQGVADTATHLPADGNFRTFQLENELFELRLPGDRVLTLTRDYQGRQTVLAPGEAPALLDDLLVMALAEFTVILARRGHWLAVCARRPELSADS